MQGIRCFCRGPCRLDQHCARNPTSPLAQVRTKSYGSHKASKFRPNLSSIAVPVKLDGATTACVLNIWIRCALSIKEATSRYVEPLIEIAD
ncbi:hypothetical protein QO004_006130 [Rhizobium mesoamericanum]|nr:hypothetical protein [Rhizobium mesoamericanum]